MIIDLNKFIKEERPFWAELDDILGRLERDSAYRLDLEGIKRFHYLYQKASVDLAKIMGFSSEQEIRIYLESLVGRAFAETHEARVRSGKFNPFKWFFHTFPRTFRRQIAAFWISFMIISAGTLFGIAAITIDEDAKAVLMPFSHLMGDPADRVAKEESVQKDRLAGHKSTFSSQLIANNTRVSIFAMALGISWGIGTIIVLFSNGVMLGAVIADYVIAGQSGFLAGWLIPHGVIEIPAIVLAGQAGLVLAGSIIGWGKPVKFRARLRAVSGDLVTLIGGVAVLLVWAGFIEAFLSQYHEPVIPYSVKIAFGVVEFILLILFLGWSGRKSKKELVQVDSGRL